MRSFLSFIESMLIQLENEVHLRGKITLKCLQKENEYYMPSRGVGGVGRVGGVEGALVFSLSKHFGIRFPFEGDLVFIFSL